MSVSRSNLYVVSSRGPLDFKEDPEGRPSGGGVASALRGALPCVAGPVVWVAAAQSPPDQLVAGQPFEAFLGDKRIQVRYVDTHADWGPWADLLMQVQLCRTSYVERHDAAADREAFAAYQEANHALARALLDAMKGDDRPMVMINDPQVMLVAGAVRQERPDAQMWFFNHTPWASAEAWRVIPRRIRRELVGSLLACDMVAFHWDRWANAFLSQAEELGWEVNWRPRRAHGDDGVTAAMVFPAAADGNDYRALAATPEAQALKAELAPDGMRTIVTIDRSDPTKDVLAMNRALGLLFDRRPDLCGHLLYHQHVIPSRQILSLYRDYLEEIKRAGVAFNREWGFPGGWQPLVPYVGNDRTRAAAELSVYDVLVVCPNVDGMNLVAQEGPHLNPDGVLILSENTGAAGLLGGAGAILIDPFDDHALAAAVEKALDMPASPRRRRGALLNEAVADRSPGGWLLAQLRHLTGETT